MEVVEDEIGPPICSTSGSGDEVCLKTDRGEEPTQLTQLATPKLHGMHHDANHIAPTQGSPWILWRHYKEWAGYGEFDWNDAVIRLWLCGKPVQPGFNACISITASLLFPYWYALSCPLSVASNGCCCDMRLVQIRNQAAPSELAPKCLYRRPSWLEINLVHCCIYRPIYPSEITSQFIPLNYNRLWARE